MADDKLRVRMYGVGFGDCFLLTIPDTPRERRVLIDCGVHPAGPGRDKMATMVQRVIEDVTDDDGVARIDVVIGTHRHADHVSGFAKPGWSAVEVGEVWLPWTEDPDDPDGRRILEKQAGLAAGLVGLTSLSDAAVKALKGDPDAAGQAALDRELKDPVRALFANSLTNESAMNTLHKGFVRQKKDPRYLSADAPDERLIETDLLPGVKVHVLGPSRDERVIRDMEPDDNEAYLTALKQLEAKDGDKLRPFEPRWEISEKKLRSMEAGVLSPQIASKIEKLSKLDALSVAVSLAKAVNGTSLMLMFQVGQQYLLFAGDAQWGTWLAALDDPPRRKLLARTTFYKVGHHGSHNATHPRFVDGLTSSEMPSMVSTREDTSDWEDIPRKPLLTALKAKGPVLRSDKKGTGEPAHVERDQERNTTDILLPI